MAKKVTRVVALAVAAAALFGCATPPNPNVKPEGKKKTAKFDVIEHKASSIGGEVPEWVAVYVSDGSVGLEALPKYKDKYVFVGEDSGANLNGLRAWVQGFNVAQEMARLVSTRVQAKFAGAMAGSPDAEVARYFENVVKNVSEATISGARKETDFWVYKRYYKADGRTMDREVYDYYILTVIDKESLKKQLNDIIAGAKPAKPLTTDQAAAVNHVKESLMTGF
jgi:hypothetical protein